MRCSGCGKNIPFGGEVCPYCLRDKKSDQSATVVGFIAMLLGGFAGNLIGGFPGMIVGGLILGVVAAIATMGSTIKAAKKPPIVQVQSQTPMPTAKRDPASGVKSRLLRLDGLLAEGVITDAEHKARRAAIIDTL